MRFVTKNKKVFDTENQAMQTSAWLIFNQVISTPAAIHVLRFSFGNHRPTSRRQTHGGYKCKMPRQHSRVHVGVGYSPFIVTTIGACSTCAPKRIDASAGLSRFSENLGMHFHNPFPRPTGRGSVEEVFSTGTLAECFCSAPSPARLRQ